MKRYLYLWHRWLGIGMCLLMALWFVSGVVMLYVGYPKLTQAEHLSRLPTLALTDCCVEPLQILQRMDAHAGVLRLTTVAGEPRYLFTQRGAVHAFDARSGEPVSAVDVEQAVASARQFAPGASIAYQRLVDEDTWTHSRGLDADRPLHRLHIDDAQRRLLYVSSASGAVVRDVTQVERVWNWLGAWLHWIYPLRGNLFNAAWHDVVVYLSIAGTLTAVLGLVIGLLRWRFGKPYRNGSRSPYRVGWARWHHIGGLFFGAVLIAWIFSGLMSMRPWDVLAGQSAFSMVAYQGSHWQESDSGLTLEEALGRMHAANFRPHELEWRIVAGQIWLVGYRPDGATRVISLHQDAEPAERIAGTTLELAAQLALPDSSAEFEWLQDYDFYYLNREQQSMYGARVRPLPVLRARFDDPASTWVHLDPATGSVVDVLDQQRRLYRWMFNLLHSWDLPWLLERPMLRELLIVLFSLGGAVISLSGAVIGWRRLKRVLS